MKAIYAIFAVTGWIWTIGFLAYLWFQSRKKRQHDQQL
jgi:hypothetical protein